MLDPSMQIFYLDSIPYRVVPDQLALCAKDEQTVIESARRLLKPDPCNSCAPTGMCPGLDREYFELVGGHELQPIPLQTPESSRPTIVRVS